MISFVVIDPNFFEASFFPAFSSLFGAGLSLRCESSRLQNQSLVACPLIYMTNLSKWHHLTEIIGMV
jgi:uncharacterized membrane protein YeiB